MVSLKMDGENTTLYPDYLHARSINPMKHSSQDWIKSFHSRIKHSIPEGHRICGENLFAEHSIPYKKLDSFFNVFSIWDGDTCLDWEQTKKLSSSLKLKTVPVIYQGVWDEAQIIQAWLDHQSSHEGFVVRLASSFKLEDFPVSIAKYVRKNHVQTDIHWRANWKPNKLKK